MLEYKGVKIRWLGHDTFKISNGKSIMIDPYQLKNKHKVDILLITHEHFDHLSNDDIKKVVDADTSIVAPQQCKEMLKMNFKNLIIVKPNTSINVQGIKIETVPAYNVNKINPSTNKPFHPKENENVGYIITMNDVRIYHAGDTDAIEEMRNINVDIALLPVSGTYVMTAEEAANAVKMIKPKLAIPMHYDSIVGTINDANKFKMLVRECEVKILEKEA